MPTEIEMVRKLAGVPEDIDGDLVSFYLEQTKEFVRGYCHRTDVPAGLASTVLQMAALRLKANVDGGSASAGVGMKGIQSVTDGSQSVSYARVTGLLTYVSDADFVSAYGALLDRYRKMDRVGGVRGDCLGARRQRDC